MIHKRINNMPSPPDLSLNRPKPNIGIQHGNYPNDPPGMSRGNHAVQGLHGEDPMNYGTVQPG